MLCENERVGGEGVKIKCRMCIVLHPDCEQFSIRFHFEMTWDGKNKEKRGVISAWRV